MGKDWHGLCLKCEKCNKTLVPGQVKKKTHKTNDGGSSLIGDKTFFNSPKILVSIFLFLMCIITTSLLSELTQHAEHEGKPYCNNPCYSALFGPGGKRIQEKN